MKKTLLFLLIVLMVVSCRSTYYLSTVKTTSPNVSQSENGDFIFENDSLSINYSFYGPGAPIQITVYNKLDIPLYVDWQRSALVIDSTAVSYIGKTVQMRGNIHGRYTSWVNYFKDDLLSSGKFRGSVDGFVDVPKNVNFIPPKSKITETPITLNVSFEDISKKEFRNAKLGTKDEKMLNIKRADFSLENTPLVFKSYLALYFEGQSPIYYEDEFYLSCLLKSAEFSPTDLPKSLAKRGDLFYVEKQANKRAMNAILATTILVGSAAIDVWLDSDPNDFN